MNSWSSSWYLLSPIKLSLLFFILIFLPCLDECHCLIFEFGDPFFCLMWSDVESLYWIFQFNYCIFQLCDLFGTFKYVLFVEISFGLCTVLLASVVLVLNFLSSKSLISISLRSISGGLSYFVWNISCVLHFLCLSVLVSAHRIKQPPLPVLTEWSPIGDKFHQSAWAELMLVSQTSVTVQATIFALPVLEWLCQDLSVSQRRGLHLMPRCRLVRS